MSGKDNKIISAAYDCFIRYGVKRTTMGDVAQAAGVSRPTLYASYSNKEELLGGVIGHYYTALIQKSVSRPSLCIRLMPNWTSISNMRSWLYDLSQSWPDAEDIFEFGNQSALDAMRPHWSNKRIC